MVCVKISLYYNKGSGASFKKVVLRLLACLFKFLCLAKIGQIIHHFQSPLLQFCKSDHYNKVTRGVTRLKRDEISRQVKIARLTQLTLIFHMYQVTHEFSHAVKYKCISDNVFTGE